MAATAALPLSGLSAGQCRWFGFTCLALTITFDLICLVLTAWHPDTDYATVAIGLSTFLLFAAVGALILYRVPAHPVGILFAIAPVGMMATNADDFYVRASEIDLPGRALVATLLDPFWAMGAFSLGVYLPLLFPTGTYLSPRWRWVGWALALALVLLYVSWAFRPGELADTEGYENPIGIPGTRPVMLTLEVAAIAIVLPCLLAGVVSLILRFRRSRGVEREQMKWFVAAMLTVITLFAASEPLSTLAEVSVPDAIFLLLMALVPASVGVAILRYRLYDIDLIINRAIVYGSLTAFLAGLYAAAVQLFKVIFEGLTGETSDASIILTTLLLAAVFTPAKNRLQKLVDRYFGTVHDPQKELSAYDDRLRAFIQVFDARENAREFLNHTVQSLNLTGGAAYLRADSHFVSVATAGEGEGERPLRIALDHDGDEVGFLLLGPRADGLDYQPDEIEALKTTAGLVGQAIGLVERWQAPVADNRWVKDVKPSPELR
jgi:hypothetical protein